MGFFSRLSTLGNRTLARSIAESFVETYLQIQQENLEASKEEQIRNTLRRMEKWSSAKEFADSDFLSDEENLDIKFVIYNLAIEESPVNRNRLSIPAKEIDAYNDEIISVLNERNIYEKS